MVWVPKKFYLDTNHLINIAKLRSKRLNRAVESYAAIERCIREHGCGVVFSSFSPLEWVEGAATPESAHEIGAVLEGAPLVYEVEGDSMILTREILDEVHRIEPSVPTIHYPFYWARQVGASVRRALGVIASTVPGYADQTPFLDGPALSPTVPEVVPTEPISESVQMALDFRKRRPRAYRERTDGFGASLEQDLLAFRKGMSLRSHFPAWAQRFLKLDQILGKLAPGQNVEALLERVEIDRCPGLKLWFDAREKRLRKGATQTINPNDVHDWEIVAAIPYLDVVLTERQLRSILHEADPNLRAKVTSDPKEAVAFLLRE